MKEHILRGNSLWNHLLQELQLLQYLEDTNGDVILVALYNFLPDGLYGRESIPLASSKLPMGATVRIAGPFLKIFQDGSRGIRI
jgi:hypothetical protein